MTGDLVANCVDEGPFTALPGNVADILIADEDMEMTFLKRHIVVSPSGQRVDNNCHLIRFCVLQREFLHANSDGSAGRLRPFRRLPKHVGCGTASAHQLLQGQVVVHSVKPCRVLSSMCLRGDSSAEKKVKVSVSRTGCVQHQRDTVRCILEAAQDQSVPPTYPHVSEKRDQ